MFDKRLLLLLPCSKNIKWHRTKVALNAAPLKNSTTWKQEINCCVYTSTVKCLLWGLNSSHYRDHAEESGIFFCVLLKTLPSQLKSDICDAFKDGGSVSLLFFSDFWVLPRSSDLQNLVHGLHHQVTSEKIFPAFFSVSHQILHLTDGSLWSRKCSSKKDFLVCWGQTKLPSFLFNLPYFCTLFLPSLSVFSLNRHFIIDLEKQHGKRVQSRFDIRRVLLLSETARQGTLSFGTRNSTEDTHSPCTLFG